MRARANEKQGMLFIHEGLSLSLVVEGELSLPLPNESELEIKLGGMWIWGIIQARFDDHDRLQEYDLYSPEDQTLCG